MRDILKNLPVKPSNANKKKLLLLIALFFILLLCVVQNFGTFDTPEGNSRTTEDRIQKIYDSLLSTRGTEHSNISIAYFYDPGCKCTIIAAPEMERVEEEYPEVKQFWYNLTFVTNQTKLIDFQDVMGYNVPSRIRDDTPFLFIGDYYLHDEEITFDNVSRLIELYSGLAVPLYPTWKVAWTMHVAYFYDPEVDSYDSTRANIELINSTWNSKVNHTIIHEYSLANPTNALLFRGYFLDFNLSKLTPYQDPNEIYTGIFIGDDFLLNQNITYQTINETVIKYSGINTPLKDIKPDISGGDICILFFFSITCGDCNKARDILEDMKGKYPELDVREYNIGLSDNLILQHSYFDYYNVPERKQGTLAVFIDDKYFVDPDELDDEIEDIIKEKRGGCPCPEVEPDKDLVKGKFLGFTVLAVLLGGLVDSINPCAIATLIFFIGYLAATGRTKKQVLLIGLAYTIGIFITYMALGLGIYSLIATSEKEIELFGEIFYPIIIIVTFIFGFYSLYDFNKARKGKKEEMKLQLPKSVKSLIGRVIKHQVPLRYFVIIAILTGVIISTLEFLCTGQVYLPTISLVAQSVPELRGQAILLLFLYNLMFVLPLVIIFVAVYFGMRSEQLQGFLDRNRAMFKLLTAIVFFVLGIFLVWYSWEFVF